MRKTVEVTVVLEYEVTGVVPSSFVDDTVQSLFLTLEEEFTGEGIGIAYELSDMPNPPDVVGVRMEVRGKGERKTYDWQHWDIRPLAHSKQSADKEVDPTPPSE